MGIKPEIWHDTKHGWSCRIVVEGLPRTFSDLSSKLAAEQVGQLQMKQLGQGAKAYTQRELQQMGFCGAPGSYEVALNKRRDRFGVVNPDGSIRKLNLLA